MSAEPRRRASTPTPAQPRRARCARRCSARRRSSCVLLVLLAWIAILNPNFPEPPVFLAFLKRAAPLVILAAGQYFVIVSGEFDLSVGSLVTVVVVVAARLIDGDAGADLAGDRAAARDRRRGRAGQRRRHDAAARAVVHHHARACC